MLPSGEGQLHPRRVLLKLTPSADGVPSSSGGADRHGRVHRRVAGRAGATASSTNVGDGLVILANLDLSGAELGTVQLLDGCLGLLLQDA